MNETGRIKTASVIAAVLFVFAVVGFFFLNAADQAVLLRTLALSLGAAAIAIPFALLAAVCVSRRTVLSGVFLLTLIGLSVLPPYINVSCWDAAFGKLGWLTSAQGQILKPLLSGWSAAIWVHAIGLVPQFALLFIVAMAIGRSFEDQARLDLSATAIFFHMTLRRLLPLVLMCVFWATLVCSRDIGVTDLYQIGTLAEQIYLGYSLGQVNALPSNWSAEEIAAAGNTGLFVRGVLFLFLASVSVLFFSSLSGFSKEASSTLAGGSWASRPRGDLRHVLGAIVVIAILIFVPAVNLILQSGSEVVTVDSQVQQQWVLSNVVSEVTKAASDFSSAFMWSGLIGLVAATIILVVATSLSFVARSRSSIGWALILVTSLFAGISGPDIGSGLTYFFSSFNNRFAVWIYDETIWPAVAANVIYCWPMSVVVIWFAISQTTSDQLESAQLDSVGFFQRVFEFGFRSNWPMLTGVWFLIYAISFSELSATQMLLPPGIETVPQVTLGKLHAGVNGTTAALSMLTIGLVVALAMVAWIIVTMAKRSKGG